MEALYERCCGLDVHKKTVVACLVTPGPGRRPKKEVRTFGTMTDDLLALADWLAAAGCTHVAMESTGVYWQPIWNLLEGRFELLLVNAQHIKAVPGRKTDVRDCEWIADLLRHGLLRGSAVPERARRELRELTRYRTALIRERAAEVNRLQKVLEGANIKLAAVATDIMGVSARRMLQALVAGETDATVLADLALGQLQKKHAELERALAGRFGPHQRYLVATMLAHIDYLDARLAELSAVIEEQMRPFQSTIDRLDTIPGIGRRIAEILVAELGTDLRRFPTAGHLASWAGVCPGNYESAGKQRTGRTRKGNPWLRWALIEAAQAGGRTRGSYLAALLRRLTARRGKKRALIAVAHSILVSVYYLMMRSEPYADLGPDHFDRLNQRRTERRLVQRLEGLGYDVSLTRRSA
jgi:transposase